MTRNLTLLASLAVTTVLADPAHAQVTAIKAGTLVDPASGTAQANQIVLVEDDTILDVGGDVAIPDGAVEIDLSAMTVLPGLFDTHTHLATSYDSEVTNLKEFNLNVSTAERALQGVVNARAFLDAGFTTIRDLGNAGNFADAALVRFLGVRTRPAQAGEPGFFAKSLESTDAQIPGPTTYISGKIISPFGGQFRVIPEHPDIGRHDYFYADTHDEIRKAIRENLHYGATWIKIVVDDFRYSYSADDLRFIVEESARAGVPVAAHCVTDEGARHAIEAGVASIEHGYEMSDATLELARQRGVVLVGTETPEHLQVLYGRASRYPPILDRLKRAHRIGVTMAFGSDVLRTIPGYTRGSLALSPVDTWVDAGIPAGDILRAMTTNAAALLGVEDERGAIRAGLAADLVATPGNPLDDITVLKRVAFVMKDGIVYKDERPTPHPTTSSR